MAKEAKVEKAAKVVKAAKVARVTEVAKVTKVAKDIEVSGEEDIRHITVQRGVHNGTETKELPYIIIIFTLGERAGSHPRWHPSPS